MYELSFQIFIFIHIRPPFRLSRSTYYLSPSLFLLSFLWFHHWILWNISIFYFFMPRCHAHNVLLLSIQTIKCNEQARKQLIQPTSLHLHSTAVPLNHWATQLHRHTHRHCRTTQQNPSNPTNPATRLLFEIISHCSSQIDLELFVHRQAPAGIHNEVNRAWLSATKVCQP